MFREDEAVAGTTRVTRMNKDIFKCGCVRYSSTVSVSPTAWRSSGCSLLV